MTQILAIDHVQITVPSEGVPRARDFYCGVLGLPEITKPAALRDRGGFWLQVGDRQLHVGVEDDVDRFATKAHVAFRVDDLAGWRDRLMAAGVELVECITIPGAKRFEFRDPFGNRIEFLTKGS